MTQEMKPVQETEDMPFFCGPDNQCFNECCRDLNQALTPYDILRLKNNLGIASAVFLRRYTSCHSGPASGLPVVGFKPNPATGHTCPFVTGAGCSVYPDRPASCRMYPLARAISRSRTTGEIQQYFALIEEDHCKGLGKNTGKTVRQWLDTQDVDTHNFYNDKLMALISLKNRLMPGRLEGVQADMFYLALYDLDTFRHQIFHQDLLAESCLPQSVSDSIRTSDESLLDVGLQWIQNRLFGRDMHWS